jgi:hypothetical protein
MEVKCNATVSIELNAREASTLHAMAKAMSEGNAIVGPAKSSNNEMRETAQRFAQNLELMNRVHEYLDEMRDRHGIK